MPIDWLGATIEHRKALYRAVRRAMDNDYLNWTQVFALALNGERLGTGYEDTFRAGRIGRKRAKRLYEWLARDHPIQAMRLDDELGVSDAEDREGTVWQDLLAAHGRYEGVSAVLLPDASIGIVTLADPEPLARPVISLGASFCFQLYTDLEGGALAFQQVERQWYPLPLSDKGLAEIVTAGRQYVPRLPDSDRPAPLSEEQHGGRHAFAFLVVTAAMIGALTQKLIAGRIIPPTTLDEIARAIEGSAEPWRLYRINLLFSSQRHD